MAFCLPMRLVKRSNWADPLEMVLHRDPGCFDHHATQILVLATLVYPSEKLVVF